VNGYPRLGGLGEIKTHRFGFFESIGIISFTLGLSLIMVLAGCVSSPRTKEQSLAQMRLGESMLKEGRTTQALNELNKAVNLDPDNAQIRNVLGVAYMEKGMLPEAVQEFRKALDLAPDFAEVHNNLGTALLRQGKVQEAIKEFNEALKSPLYLTPHFGEYNLGRAYYQMKDYVQAKKHFQEAVKISPSYSMAYLGLGETCMAVRQWDEAAEALKKAIEYAPRYVEAHYDLGEVLVAQYQTNLARMAFKEVIRLDPEGPWGKKAQQRLKEIY
ncbi:MAG TPA: tetratricopeptide repeat protein, partial [Thermodesulfobacteriota bacterium]|nr:tetratricopeptide repeat protein [Thermodesulfobacteriota bacterium]